MVMRTLASAAVFGLVAVPDMRAPDTSSDRHRSPLAAAEDLKEAESRPYYVADRRGKNDALADIEMESMMLHDQLQFCA